MAILDGVLARLREERTRIEKELGKVTAAIAAVEGLFGQNGRRRRVTRVAGISRKPRRRMSAAARRRIAAAQRARWAKVRAQQKKKTA